MKYLIASDIHGSAKYCRMLLERCEAWKPDRIILLGDILYHGPRNDLPEEYAPKEVAKMLNTQKQKILAVRGNCDAEVDQLMLSFPMMADYAVLGAGTHLVYLTHGHIFNKETAESGKLPFSAGDILLHGHTHVPAWEEFGNGNFYLNPGSAALPKNGTQHAYMTLEDNTFRWFDIDGGVFRELSLSK